MTKFNRAAPLARLASPGGALAVLLVVAALTACLPEAWLAPLRGPVHAALKPGQVAVLEMRDVVERWQRQFAALQGDADRWTRLDEEVQQLREENRLLAAQLARQEAEVDRAGTAGNDEQQRLLQTKALAARVLGRRARAFLVREGLLDVGADDGAQADALVIDVGADRNVTPEQLVLSGGEVCGKVVAVDRWTSTVRPVTDPNYRDLVELAHGPGAGRGLTGGVLEGTGDALCRIRLVPTTEAVAAGDWVYAAADEARGIGPLVYGRVERVERKPGSAHWDIWMRPAQRETMAHVAVLRTTLNPLRVADGATFGAREGRTAR